jgi:cysteine-rich repeat protein
MALGVGGCLEVPGMTCEDGRICPSGMVCAPTGCALPQQLEACAGKGPGEPCSYAGLASGTCIDELCISSGCGNGVRDEGEACDDGRRCADGTPCQGACADESACQPRGGFGCSRDCLKVEECGDGFVDEGEACDDGNENPADGCDRCALTQWVAEAAVGGGILGTSVGLNVPSGVAVDASGNVFVADTYNNRVRRVEGETGVVTTVAGTGAAGFSGDDGPATSAQLSRPGGVVVDGLGNLFIADTGNHRIRRVEASTGVITTVAGTGVAGSSGDGGPATSAQLTEPAGLAVDGLGNLFIADTGNHRIRRVDATTGVMATVAGTGAAGSSGDGGPAANAALNMPWRVAVGGAGHLYIADTMNHRIRRVDAVTAFITTVAGTGAAGFGGDGGPAISALLDHPRGVAVDGLGHLYIADTVNHRIRRVDAATGLITTVAGTGEAGFSGDDGPATIALLEIPWHVAVDRFGHLFIADMGNQRIRRVDAATQAITTVVGTRDRGFLGDGGFGTSARLAEPSGVGVDGFGNLFIADYSHHRIRRVDGATGVITTAAGTGLAGFSGDGITGTSAQFYYPSALAIDGLGNLFVSDEWNHRVRRWDATTGVVVTVAGTGIAGFSGDGGPATSAQLRLPSGVAVDDLGNVFIAEPLNHRVRRIDAATGVITTVAGTGVGGFSGDGGPATTAQVNQPYAVAIDGRGNLFIADRGNHRIRRVDGATGEITTVAGTGESGFSGDGGPATSAQLNQPRGVAVDGLGNIIIADYSNHRIRRVDGATEVITTLAGTGEFAFSGDGGPATDASLWLPIGVAIDDLGNMFVADAANHRVRRVDGVVGTIATVAGPVAPEGMGPVAMAQISDPRALVLAPPLTWFAGSASGTLQVLDADSETIEVVAGRYPHAIATANLARFRNASFGSVGGIAYDPSAGLIYLTESSSNRIHVVTIVDPDDKHTWTIANLANESGTAGFANGPAATARFRNPTGLFLDEAAQVLYVADTGNHVLRAIDVSGGVASASVATVAGTPETLGFFGDYGPATGALMYQPQAVTRCTNGDIFVADTGNHRVRRIEPNGIITTVLGDGTAASSGQGAPAYTFPVNAPLGLACDPLGNLLVTSTSTVRLVAADDAGVVDGTGVALTIYGAPPRDTFPASVTRCLTGLAVVDAATVQVTDSCTGILVELTREPLP